MLFPSHDRIERGAEIQRNQILQDAKRLSSELSLFAEEKKKIETQFALRQSEQDARQNLLDEREKAFIEREKKIENDKLIIKNQFAELEKTAEYIRKQQHGIRIS